MKPKIKEPQVNKEQVEEVKQKFSGCIINAQKDELNKKGKEHEQTETRRNTRDEIQSQEQTSEEEIENLDGNSNKEIEEHNNVGESAKGRRWRRVHREGEVKGHNKEMLTGSKINQEGFK
ncbi:Cytochrome P450 84A4 [Bienertia sinuspersici]